MQTYLHRLFQCVCEWRKAWVFTVSSLNDEHAWFFGWQVTQTTYHQVFKGSPCMGVRVKQNERLSPIALPLPTAKADLVSSSRKTRPSNSNWAARDHFFTLLVLKNASQKSWFSILELHFYLLILYIYYIFIICCILLWPLQFLLQKAAAFVMSAPKGPQHWCSVWRNLEIYTHGEAGHFKTQSWNTSHQAIQFVMAG